MSFHGSYDPADVTFLLKPVHLAPTPVTEKERLIQSGQRHYSEILAPESPPSGDYLRLFDAAFARNRDRMARDLVALAKALDRDVPGPFVIASLARAGTPIGVLLRRGLTLLGREIPHYSISIIRDRGIDRVALADIQRQHPDATILFVDGWSGKGAIARELHRALAGTGIEPRLVVLSDLAGVADLAASSDDYLIPSSILNAVISGLVSRSVLNDMIRPGDFHGTVFYEDMRPHDRSRWFVDEVAGTMESLLAAVDVAPAVWSEARRSERRHLTQTHLNRIMRACDLSDRNRVKPGIGEATRAALRRVPDRVFLRDPDAADVQHLVHLAGERGVDIEVDSELPYAALTIIRRLGAKHAAWKP